MPKKRIAEKLRFKIFQKVFMLLRGIARIVVVQEINGLNITNM